FHFRGSQNMFGKLSAELSQRLSELKRAFQYAIIVRGELVRLLQQRKRRLLLIEKVAPKNRFPIKPLRAVGSVVLPYRRHKSNCSLRNFYVGTILVAVPQPRAHRNSTPAYQDARGDLTSQAIIRKEVFIHNLEIFTTSR